MGTLLCTLQPAQQLQALCHGPGASWSVGFLSLPDSPPPLEEMSLFPRSLVPSLAPCGDSPRGGGASLQGHSGQGSLLTPRPGRFPPPCVLTFGGGRGPWHHLPDVPRALGSGPLAGVGASMEGVVVASSPATG